MDGKKVDRILDIYTRLLSGKKVNKTEIAHKYGVSERSVQRDINDIRNFCDNEAMKTMLNIAVKRKAMPWKIHSRQA